MIQNYRFGHGFLRQQFGLKPYRFRFRNHIHWPNRRFVKTSCWEVSINLFYSHIQVRQSDLDFDKTRRLIRTFIIRNVNADWLILTSWVFLSKTKFSCIWRKTWISNHITFGFIFLFRLFPKSTSSIWEDNRHSNGSYFLHGHYYQSIWNYYRTVYSLYSF